MGLGSAILAILFLKVADLVVHLFQFELYILNLLLGFSTRLPKATTVIFARAANILQSSCCLFFLPNIVEYILSLPFHTHVVAVTFHESAAQVIQSLHLRQLCLLFL